MERVARVPGWRVLAVIAGWAVTAAAVFGLLVLSGRLGARSYLRGHANDVSAAFLLVLYVLLLGALWIAFGGPRGFARTLGFRYSAARHLLLAPVFWLATVLVGALVSVPFERWFGSPKSNATPLVKSATDPFATGVLVFTVVLLGPVCEELLFRGAVFGWLRGHVPAILAAAVSAALFSAAHLFAPAAVALFVFGLAAALFYQRTGSTLNTFVMHACQNAAAMAAIYSGFVKA